MPSQASVEIRKTIVKDELRTDIPLHEKRQAWEDAALSTPVRAGIQLKEEIIGQVPCLMKESVPQSVS